ncbi:unnamed protein product [Effrenium voratum]|nr:unnamed protein product [Effrenium voratum]
MDMEKKPSVPPASPPRTPGPARSRLRERSWPFMEEWAKLRHTSRFLVRASLLSSHPEKKRSGDALHGAAQVPTGILVHGCHLSADGWEQIVWGRPPHELGRLPHAVLLAWEERATVVVFGTGASEKDGLKESEYTLKYLWDRWSELAHFEPLHRVPLDKAQELMRAVSVIDASTQNTDQEVREGLRVMREKGCHHAVLVSSPTHLPRCLACACKVVEEEPELFEGPIYASPSDTCYQGASSSDVVVVEPPHRGDRDKSLDALKFHELVRRSYGVPKDKKVEFLQKFTDLLEDFGWHKGQFSTAIARLPDTEETRRKLQDILAQDAAQESVRAEAAPLLAELRRRGFRLALLSNAATPSYTHVLQHPELRELLDPDLCFFSCDMGLVKPDVRIFELICSAAQVPKSCALMVGDSLRSDFHGSRSAGLRQVLLDVAGCHADIHPRISSLSELLTLLPEKA